MGLDGTWVTAQANSGYKFTGWSDGSTQNPRKDTNVTANISVTANFAPKTATRTPPDTIIDTGPGDYTTSTSATFTFHSTESGSTFQCKLDSQPGPPAPARRPTRAWRWAVTRSR